MTEPLPAAFHMADVGGKSPSFRRALAMGRIHVGAHAFDHIKNGTLPKGDVLKIAEIAGITGAKATANLIPLCHPLPLDHVAVYIDLEQDTVSVAVYCVAAAYAKTGVEMEALAGVNGALLTLYDLTKPVEPALTIQDIRLLVKEGGKKGRWVCPEGVPERVAGIMPDTQDRPLEEVKAAIVTLSDRASSGEYEDKSGPKLRAALEFLGAEVLSADILPDDEDAIAARLSALADGGEVDLIITTGGTGLTPRDVAPEAIARICVKTAPGIGEALRAAGGRHLPTAWLSRSLAAVRAKTLIVALPGSPKAIDESMDVLKPFLRHAVRLAKGGKHNCNPRPDGHSGGAS
ncbi:MAG: bifunctional molybdenum cofactor biosynthesis protein MoaC/MoaB [Robiginitomaculum sp.]|nr:MAG: bifunctional molybdenum cofactor biosynthesis protein MoaC/MoaB [Robiginitomaculum sp.]